MEARSTDISPQWYERASTWLRQAETRILVPVLLGLAVAGSAHAQEQDSTSSTMQPDQVSSTIYMPVAAADALVESSIPSERKYPPSPYPEPPSNVYAGCTVTETWQDTIRRSGEIRIHWKNTFTYDERSLPVHLTEDVGGDGSIEYVRDSSYNEDGNLLLQQDRRADTGALLNSWQKHYDGAGKQTYETIDEDGDGIVEIKNQLIYDNEGYSTQYISEDFKDPSITHGFTQHEGGYPVYSWVNHELPDEVPFASEWRKTWQDGLLQMEEITIGGELWDINRYYYDDEDRLIKQVDFSPDGTASGEYTLYEYNPQGLIERREHYMGHLEDAQTYTYNLSGQLTESRSADHWFDNLYTYKNDCPPDHTMQPALELR